jgi:hypothetical protein
VKREERERPGVRDWRNLWRIDRRFGTIEPKFPMGSFLVSIAELSTAEGALAAILDVARTRSDSEIASFVRAVAAAVPRAARLRRAQ